jgi:hypothetical protein
MTDLGVNESELKVSVISMKLQVWETLIHTIQVELSDGPLLEKLRRKFESVFRYDEKGLPRVWKPTDDIDTLFSRAKHEVSGFYIG